MNKPDCMDSGQKATLDACDECDWSDSCDVDSVDPAEDDSEGYGICPHCSGSGEGMYDGTRCKRCGGSGESKPGIDPDEPPDWWLEEQAERRRGEY